MASVSWLFPAHEVAQQLAGRDAGVRAVTALARALKAPATTLGMATTLFYRACMCLDAEAREARALPVACVYLALKINDTRPDTDALLAAAGAHVAFAAVTHLELQLLHMLGFDPRIDLPIATLADARLTTEELQRAFMLLHDTFETPLCLLFPPATIAAALVCVVTDATPATLGVQQVVDHLRLHLRHSMQ